ncbi:hypothetical protein BJV82DRAFT_591002 [Fennellomyces sp. T-0311]|nr:hypothetical protein BJV82DRAFT_591002 [Fennellomyces sp. T-0311]
MTGTKPMKEIVELPSGWIPIRHPEVPDMISSYYFVNQDESAIYSVARGKFVPIAPVRRLKALGPRYNIAGKTALKLEEIMAHTFLEHFDSSKHYILHKDGQAENCAWNNLIICYDLPTLQRHEIARLQKLYPDAKYTVVRNVHATSTFEHYLVSDTGNIYSLIERRHIHIGYCSAAGYLVAPLSTDIGIKQATKQFCRLAVHSVVMQSFNGSRTRERVFHINGNRLDNALINLTYIKSRTQTLEKEKVPVEEQAESSTRIMPLPSPPVTDNLKWKNVGVLPWDGQGYTQYEVSDMGHVRRKDTSEIVPFFVGKHGHTYVSMYKDCQGPKKYRSTRTVARLVANAFVDGYTGERDWVDHLNGDQHDNRALNLRWVHREKKPVCPIVVSLVDDPKIQREFRSTRKLQRELHVCDVKAVIEKYGGTFTKTIEWNGEKKLAQFRLLSSEENNK